jgi:hydroxycarboxylate dehydrogenase B
LPLFCSAELLRLAQDCFAGVGVADADAALVAGHLLDAGLCGHDSHGMLRLPQYVEMVRKGTVDPLGAFKVLDEGPSRARVSGGWHYGPVTATQAVDLALDKAGAGAVAVVTVRDCNHVARLGSFAALAPPRGQIVLMCSNGHGGDLAVAPHGGRDRRLPTNPLCLALPTGREWPLVLDMTTSATSGGAMRLAQNRGEDVPAGRIIDAEGEATVKVGDFYGPPPGAMLPLGAPLTGHKGFGLAVAVDILAGALSGAGCSKAQPERSGNALFIAALNIEAFVSLDAFEREADEFIGRLKASPAAPGFNQVEIPGERAYGIRQRRLVEGVPVDASAWQQIGDLAAELRVELPVPLPN